MIDWTQVLVAAIAGLLSGAAITAAWKGLEARSASRRSDDKAHIEAADAVSELSSASLRRMVEEYEARIARYDERLAALEEKCRRYEMAFESMRLDLVQARLTISQLETANGELQKRVKALEDENAELRRRLDDAQRIDGG